MCITSLREWEDERGRVTERAAHIHKSELEIKGALRKEKPDELQRGEEIVRGGSFGGGVRGG